MRQLLVLAFLVSSSVIWAAAVPGGTIRSAESMGLRTYELVLSPAITLAPSGAYLSSELRYQPAEDIGAGLAFGAGQVGFNFGSYAVWHILPDLETQPAFSILGGLYFNRFELANYFVVKMAPTLSKTWRWDGGRVSPYVALPFSPSFRLGDPRNDLTMKVSVGTELVLSSLQGMRLWTEVGLGLMESAHEVVIAASYPFTALGG